MVPRRKNTQTRRRGRHLAAKLKKLRAHCDELEETLDAIRSGGVDAIVVYGEQGEKVFTLHGAEYPYRVLVEAMNEGAAVLGTDHTVLHCNTRFAQMLGVDLHKAIGHPIWPFVAPGEREALEGLLAQALRGSVRAEAALLSRQGVRVPVQLSVGPVNLEGLSALSLLATDLTQVKQAEEALRESLQFTTQIVSHAGEGIVVYDRSLRLSLWNAFMEQMTGMPARRILGRHALEVFPQTADRGLYALLERALAGETVSSPDTPYHLPGSAKSGWAVALFSPQRDAREKVVGVIGVVRDITAHKRAERRLATQHAVARILAESGTFPAGKVLQAIGENLGWDLGGVWEVDRGAGVLRWVEGWHAPSSRAGSMGSGGLRTFPKGVGLLGRVWETGQPLWIPDINTDPAFLRGEAARRAGLRSAFAFAVRVDGDVLGVVEFFSRRSEAPDPDLMEVLAAIGNQLGQFIRRMKAEEEVRISGERLRQLAGHTLSVREEERTRIAREIHDELGQALTAIKMDLAWLGGRLSSRDRELQKKIRSTLQVADSTIRSVRRISTELRPGILDDLGLVAALEWQAQEFQTRTGIRCRLQLPPEEFPVSAEVATAFFRIFQEAVTNVARHARARTIEAGLERQADRLVLSIRDDGRGFRESARSRGGALGLLGIRERAVMLGGEVEIQSAPGKGTSIRAWLPFPQQRAARAE